MREVYGPWQRIVVLDRYGWTVAAEQVPLPSGDVQWDVVAHHSDGSRVPQGRNLHEEPSAELQRLATLIDPPRTGGKP